MINYLQIILVKIYSLIYNSLGFNQHPEKNDYIKTLLCVDDIYKGRLADVHKYSPYIHWRRAAVYPRGFEMHSWFLFNFCTNNNIKTIVEFGIREGLSTLILAAAKANNGQFWTVDPSDKYRDFVNYNLKYYNLQHSCQRIKNDSISFIKVWQEKNHNQKIDLVMIDSKHAYSLKIKEINLWMPLINPGGAMIFHDVIHCADNNQAGIDSFLSDKKVCYLETDGWLLPDDEITTQVHNNGHHVNMDIKNWKPFRQVDKPEEESQKSGIFSQPKKKITHKQAGAMGFQYSYEVRTNGQGLGILVKHY